MYYFQIAVSYVTASKLCQNDIFHDGKQAALLRPSQSTSWFQLILAPKPRASLTDRTPGCRQLYTVWSVLPPARRRRADITPHLTCEELTGNIYLYTSFFFLHISHRDISSVESVDFGGGCEVFLSSRGVNQCDRSLCQTVPPTQRPIGNCGTSLFFFRVWSQRSALNLEQHASYSP